ncbi:MAG TPA: lipoate--protein ligase family protein [Clostridia bacterium]|nr:lipoate--protein ligase family protein [Clostridia bacterium]
MKPTWRKLDLGHKTAAENMTLDEVVLTACSQGLIPNTLRFLQFRPHCALVGFFQEVDKEIHVDYCRQHQIDINRRITGGGAIYFDETTLGWEIIALKNDPLFHGPVEELYSYLCQGVIKGLGYLGVKARFRPRNDIEVDGRKISGTGGTELEHAFLFQGTVLVDFNVDTMLNALNIPVKKLVGKEVSSIRERVVCLRELLGYVPAGEAVKDAIAKGFAEVLGVKFEESGLTEQEEKMLSERLPYFASRDWIDRVHKKESQRKSVSAIYKGEGGLIRTSLVVDVPGNRIKSALITGDFFAYPGRIIMDLEAALKDCRAEAAVIRDVVRQCFSGGNAQIPGLTADDFSLAVMEAVTAAREAKD